MDDGSDGSNNNANDNDNDEYGKDIDDDDDDDDDDDYDDKFFSCNFTALSLQLPEVHREISGPGASPILHSERHGCLL